MIDWHSIKKTSFHKQTVSVRLQAEQPRPSHLYTHTQQSLQVQREQLGTQKHMYRVASSDPHRCEKSDCDPGEAHS